MATFEFMLNNGNTVIGKILSHHNYGPVESHFRRIELEPSSKEILIKDSDVKSVRLVKEDLSVQRQEKSLLHEWRMKIYKESEKSKGI